MVTINKSSFLRRVKTKLSKEDYEFVTNVLEMGIEEISDNKRWEFASSYAQKDGSVKTYYRCPECYNKELIQSPFCPTCGIELLPMKELEDE